MENLPIPPPINSNYIANVGGRSTSEAMRYFAEGDEGAYRKIINQLPKEVSQHI